MIRIHQIKCPVTKKLTAETIAKKLRASSSDILSFQIERQSLDARKENLFYTYTVLAEVRNQQRYLKHKDVSEGTPQLYEMPKSVNDVPVRPVVVGFGPSGMFAALLLAETGCKPIIIERGKSVDERQKDIEKFFTNAVLLPESNIQFGEGGAGTFSDGKLTTRIKNIRIQKVLAEFIEAGADEAIAYEHRPHIGTDVLRNVVRNIREKIISLGGEIYFEERLEKIVCNDRKITAVVTNHRTIPTEHILLCMGHSASDTYETLLKQGVKMIQKDFAAGVRVEHPQSMINANQYGTGKDAAFLGAASYQLTYHASNHRGVYSFCMCPGGQVIPASTEEGSLAVNGMSYHARDGKNANSAILVQIPTSDFDHGHPLDGFLFQKELEKKAYRERFAAPSQNIRDFVSHTTSESLFIESSYPLENRTEDMHALFSDEVCKALEEGFTAFDRKIPGFLSHGIMVGMESRSSSPIRIPREDDGQSVSMNGLYPCGEGAGYAGGIVSSAVDGITQAEHVIEQIRQMK